MVCLEECRFSCRGCTRVCHGEVPRRAERSNLPIFWDPIPPASTPFVSEPGPPTGNPGVFLSDQPCVFARPRDEQVASDWSSFLHQWLTKNALEVHSSGKYPLERVHNPYILVELLDKPGLESLQNESVDMRLLKLKMAGVAGETPTNGAADGPPKKHLAALKNLAVTLSASRSRLLPWHKGILGDTQALREPLLTWGSPRRSTTTVWGRIVDIRRSCSRSSRGHRCSR